MKADSLETRPQTVAHRVAIDDRIAELALPDVDVRCAADAVVDADANHVDQILVNLLSNAAKYGRPPIAVDVSAADDYVEIRVADAGPGVDESFVPHLFEEFSHRYAPTVDAATTGTGLGLAIVRHLAEANGGSAWYESREPHGAVFGVRLRGAALQES